MMTNKLEISEKFNIDDIRKIRDYNAIRYVNMSPAEIVKETRTGAAKILELLSMREYDNGGTGDYTKEKYEQPDLSMDDILNM